MTLLDSLYYFLISRNMNKFETYSDMEYNLSLVFMFNEVGLFTLISSPLDIIILS